MDIDMARFFWPFGRWAETLSNGDRRRSTAVTGGWTVATFDLATPWPAHAADRKPCLPIGRALRLTMAGRSSRSYRCRRAALTLPVATCKLFHSRI